MNKSLKVRNKESEQSGTENSPCQDKREEMLLLQASFIRGLVFLVGVFFFLPESSGVAALTALTQGRVQPLRIWEIWDFGTGLGKAAFTFPFAVPLHPLCLYRPAKRTETEVQCLGKTRKQGGLKWEMNLEGSELCEQLSLLHLQAQAQPRVAPGEGCGVGGLDPCLGEQRHSSCSTFS